MEIILNSETNTVDFAKELSKNFRPRDIIGLGGELGAGKTFLVQAISYSLGVPQDFPVTSPTFTLINEYHGNFYIYHIDLYRLDSEAEIYGLGLEEYLEGRGITLIEWYNKFPDYMKNLDMLRIDIFIEGDFKRKIKLSGQGRRGEEIEKNIQQSLVNF